jgi:hypothetical protein
LLNQYTKIIRKTRAQNKKLEIVSSKLKELKTSKKELRENMINLRRCTMSSPLVTSC